jgi:hypothetical protein
VGHGLLTPLTDDKRRSSLPAIRAYITSVFFAVDGRNAWWGVWTNYRHQRSVSLTFENCRRYVESHRVQGSTWWINEAAALVVCAPSETLIATDLGGAFRLRLRPPDDALRPFLSQVVDELKHSGDSLLFVATNRPTRIFKRSFGRWKSQYSGGLYPFSWRPLGRTRTRQAVALRARRLEYAIRHSAYFGVLTEKCTEGTRITKFLEVSPLAEAGVQVGDILLDFDDGSTSWSCREELPILRPQGDYKLRLKRGETPVTEIRLTACSFRTAFHDAVADICRLTAGFTRRPAAAGDPGRSPHRGLRDR